MSGFNPSALMSLDSSLGDESEVVRAGEDAVANFENDSTASR
jgi:hypothetical protein